jgi:hypothetical protein
MTNEHEKTKYHYFVNKDRYEWHEPHITGKEVKDHLYGEKHEVELFIIEQHEGHEQERPVHYDTRVSLGNGPKHFLAKPKEQKVYIYFVDGDKYESENAHTTGRIIKSKLPEAKRAYALYLEGHGKQPDQLINDDTTISFEGEKEPKRFYTVPPASFGGA